MLVSILIILAKFVSYYSQHYAGIIGSGLKLTIDTIYGKEEVTSYLDVHVYNEQLVKEPNELYNCM